MDNPGKSSSFIHQIAGFIGPETDIPAPDMYTNPMIMGWMFDEYSKMYQKKIPGTMTKLISVFLMFTLAGCAMYRNQKAIEMETGPRSV